MDKTNTKTIPPKPVLKITGNKGQWISSGLYRYDAFYCPSHWADSIDTPFGASCDVSYAFYGRPKWHNDSNQQTLIGLCTEIFGATVERLELWNDSGKNFHLNHFDIQRITNGITKWFCLYSLEHARCCEIKNSQLCQEILQVVSA